MEQPTKRKKSSKKRHRKSGAGEEEKSPKHEADMEESHTDIANDIKEETLSGKANEIEKTITESNESTESKDLKLKQAEEEWNAVTLLQQKREQDALENPRTKISIVSCKEAFEYLFNSDLQQQMKGITTEDTRNRGWFESIWYGLFGQPKLKGQQAIEDRNKIFAIALLQFDNDSLMHNRILQSIHMLLTGTQLDCPRYGNHWEEIGFQGNDPATDLRGGGMLGLLQLLFFLETYEKLAHKIFTLSKDPVQNFPFCLVSINITRIVLETLREGKLTKMCNKHSVVQAVNEFHHATFLLMYTIWKSGNKKITDFGFVLKEVTEKAKKNPWKLTTELAEYEDSINSVHLKDSAKAEFQTFQ